MTDWTLHRHWHLYINTVSSLSPSSLLFVLLLQLVYRQIQLSCTILIFDSCTHMDRTDLEFHFVFAKTRADHTVILTTFTVAEQSFETAGLFTTLDLRRCGIVNDYRAPWRAHISGTALADAASWWRLWRVRRRDAHSSDQGHSPGDIQSRRWDWTDPVNADAGSQWPQIGI